MSNDEVDIEDIDEEELSKIMMTSWTKLKHMSCQHAQHALKCLLEYDKNII